MNTPVEGDTFIGGEIICLSFRFDTELVVRGIPRVALLIGATERHVDLSDNYYDDDQGFYWLNFGYRVQRGDHDADGEIIVPANGIDLNGVTITTAGADARPADLSYQTRSFPFKVDGSQYVLGFPPYPFCGFPASPAP